MQPIADALLVWYEGFGRRHLPWRQTRDPYSIVVAEFMLQQTQVERVIPLYSAFLARFPTFAALAASEGGAVIRAWRGLGYNSRAVRLRRLAQIVTADHGGRLPREHEALLALPGIGRYTAAAIRAFAFDESDIALDTNIRRVVHRLMLGLEYPPLAGDRVIDSLATAMLPAGRGHDWNSALMDLGATICTSRAAKCLICPLVRQCVAAPVDPVRLVILAKAAARRSPQSVLPFERTTRFLRGRLIDRLRDVPAGKTVTLDDLQRDLTGIVPSDRVAQIPIVMDALVRDGIVAAVGSGTVKSFLLS